MKDACYRLMSMTIHYLSSFSFVGLIVAFVFCSISLSPSLLPRPIYLQALLSSFCLLAGYGLGVLLHSLWCYLQLPELKGRGRLYLQVVVVIVCVLSYLINIFYFEQWQNSVRSLMNMSEVEDASLVYMSCMSLILSALLLSLVRLIKRAFFIIRSRLVRVLPTRLANVIGVLLLSFFVFSITNDYFIKKGVEALDEIYALADATSDQGKGLPLRHGASGSSESVIKWHEIGRQGQNFASSGPTLIDLVNLYGKEAKQPLRIYVGLRSAETYDQRADLALQEMIRINAFSRSKLIIATPTGTGWLDESAVDSLEYLHAGDTAIVAMQYSYLPSWLTLLVDPSAARESSAALYRKVHEYWSALPEQERPELYLFGLSLGALAAETSVNLATIINNPIQGALFAGAPFPSSVSPRLIRNRQVDSPAWLPVIQEASMVRFTAQENQLRNNTTWHWGEIRIVYIQYASDPMVFFSLDLLNREPDWLKGERGPDVSPDLTWYPLITFMQLLFDLPMADKVPRGSSHNYSASSYIDAWIEVTQPLLLNSEVEERVRKLFYER
ncbi:alpha/beta hydrolase [Agaribacterium sp. ZY112]|uniref:alpha/beta hydrolase n=1 Tax=Agaribacterium sp. ZY112 TaxID=3233574 RepID=UPI00352606C7